MPTVIGCLQNQWTRITWREGVARSLAEILQSIAQPTLIMGISTDILCPLQEQHFLVRHIPNAKLVEIESAYGHDGFIIEAEKISHHLREVAGTC